MANRSLPDVNLQSGNPDSMATESQLRIDLAAAFQIAAYMDWHEGVANHFSVAVSENAGTFLLNPKWKHFSGITPSDLLLLDTGDASVMESKQAPDPTAWFIHGTIHAQVPRLRCLMHLHTPYATALSCLSDPELKPIDQTTARFYKRVAIDRHYGGMADDASEGRRLANLMRDHDVLLMGNHGVLVGGRSIAETFDTIYHFERACRTLMLAYSTGREITYLSDEIALKTALAWDSFVDSSFDHFNEMKNVLARQGKLFVTQ